MIALPEWLVPLDLSMPASMGQVNAYLVRGPSGAALVDTGLDEEGCRADLLRLLGDSGLAPSDVDTVLCTHHHPDHCGLGRTFQEAGARILMSARDAETLSLFFAHPERDAGRATFFGRHAVPDEFEHRVSPMFPFFRSMAEPFEPDGHVGDGEVVDLGGIRFEVMATPGHTSGHLCLLHRGEGLVFTGDHAIAHDATHVSMREESLCADPLGLFLSSLARTRDLGPLSALPGHGEPIGDLSERSAALIAHHEARLERFEAALADEPRTAHEVNVEVMGRRPKAIAEWLAMSQALAYLGHLAAVGRARVVEREDGLAYARERG